MNITEARAELARLEAETEAARKRVAELEREPFSGWLIVDCPHGDGVGPGYVDKEEAIARTKLYPNSRAIRVVELRPGWALEDAERVDALETENAALKARIAGGVRVLIDLNTTGSYYKNYVCTLSNAEHTALLPLDLKTVVVMEDSDV